MDTSGYITLNRQRSLMNEMQSIANNLANMSTSGFRAEKVTFSEFVNDRGVSHASASFANGNVRSTDFSQGALSQTGGTLDLAIEGEGFFRIATPEGDRLTRSGAFGLTANGTLVTRDGFEVLDEGGAPIQIPLDSEAVVVGSDGTIELEGQVLSKIGIWIEDNTDAQDRTDGVSFIASDAATETEATIQQGFLEKSNVDPVKQIARMIEVQRSYELGQSLLDREDERIRNTVRDISR